MMIDLVLYTGSFFSAMVGELNNAGPNEQKEQNAKRRGNNGPVQVPRSTTRPTIPTRTTTEEADEAQDLSTVASSRTTTMTSTTALNNRPRR